MERVILYRGLTKNGRKWVHGAYIQTEDVIVDGLGERYEVLSETVGEFSGFRDVDYHSIFEGDILKWVSEDGEEGKLLVQFKYGGFVAEEIPLGRVKPDFLIDAFFERVKVIGNAHENPELMEVWKK